mmetsp:Transcript_69181/g.156890  ORF Transcript_69181/g.156890 Transcript_69181/m.156890 type:complete len:304 (-) Transcript_69181:2593-3504(-)
MDELGESLSETVCNGLQENCAVNLALILEDLALLVAAEAAGASKSSDVVGRNALGRDEVTLAPAGCLAHVELLAEAIKLADHAIALLIGIDLDVIPIGVCRPDANHTGCLQDVLLHNPSQHLLGLVEQLPCLFADPSIIEDGRIVAVGIFPTQLVHLEEWCPVDVFHNLFNGVVLDAKISNEVRLRWDLRPVHLGLHTLCLCQCFPLFVDKGSVVLFPDLGVLLLDVLQVVLLLGGEDRTHHCAAPGCVQDVDDPVFVLRCQFHCRVPLGRGGTADHERLLHATHLHLFRDIHHLVKGWCNEP